MDEPAHTWLWAVGAGCHLWGWAGDSEPATSRQVQPEDPGGALGSAGLPAPCTRPVRAPPH